MAMTLTPEQLHILQHSLGANRHGQPAHGPRPDEGDGCWWFSRNRFLTDPDCPDGRECRTLVAAGLMRDRGVQRLTDGMHCYTVTLAGRDAMMAQSPKAPKLTRGQQRYRQWRAEDGGESFGEWLLRNEHNRKVDRHEGVTA